MLIWRMSCACVAFACAHVAMLMWRCVRRMIRIRGDGYYVAISQSHFHISILRSLQ